MMAYSLQADKKELKILEEKLNTLDYELAGYVAVELKVLSSCLIGGKATPLSGLSVRRFLGLEELILFLWENADHLDHPVSQTRLRELSSFDHLRMSEKCLEQERSSYWSEYDSVKNNKLALIHICYRENTSLQGKLAIGNDSVYFRSSLELIHLLREALL